MASSVSEAFLRPPHRGGLRCAARTACRSVARYAVPYWRSSRVCTVVAASRGLGTAAYHLRPSQTTSQRIFDGLRAAPALAAPKLDCRGSLWTQTPGQGLSGIAHRAEVGLRSCAGVRVHWVDRRASPQVESVETGPPRDTAGLGGCFSQSLACSAILPYPYGLTGGGASAQRRRV